MRALSIRQPWAWLIVEGFKPIENRTWSTPYRGPIRIHAGKTFDREGFEWVMGQIEDLGVTGMPTDPADFLRGGFVGTANLVEIVRNHPSPWFFGPQGFVLEAAERTEFEAARGRLGIWTVSS